MLVLSINQSGVICPSTHGPLKRFTVWDFSNKIVHALLVFLLNVANIVIHIRHFGFHPSNSWPIHYVCLILFFVLAKERNFHINRLLLRTYTYPLILQALGSKSPPPPNQWKEKISGQLIAPKNNALEILVLLVLCRKTRWTCKDRRPVSVVQQFWCSYRLKGPSFEFLFLGRPQRITNPRKARDKFTQFQRSRT